MPTDASARAPDRGRSRERETVTLPTYTLCKLRRMAKRRHRSKPPRRGTRWYAYVGLLLLAAGVIALVVAAIASVPR